MLFIFRMINENVNQCSPNDLINSNKFDRKYFSDQMKNLVKQFDSYLNSIVRLFAKYNLNRIVVSHKQQDQQHVIIKKRIAKLNNVLGKLFEISLKNEQIKNSLVKENFILALFELCQESSMRPILGLILRLLSVLINDFDSLNNLKQKDSINLLTDILCDEELQEWSRTECAGCLGRSFN
jgi:hypothetical protein